MIQCSQERSPRRASDLQRRDETQNVPNNFLHVMLLGEEGLDLDQQLLLDHIWHKLPTLGSDCSHLFDVIQVTVWLTLVIDIIKMAHTSSSWVIF